jgi:hypothetical protein
LKPLVAPSHLLKSLKGATARESNRLLNRTGEQFWQHESYDHWVRDQREWDRIARYIERNPMKAGLVSRIEDYQWSSAHRDALLGAHKSPLPGVHKSPLPGVHKSVNAARTSACATVAGDACATATAKILA